MPPASALSAAVSVSAVPVQWWCIIKPRFLLIVKF